MYTLLTLPGTDLTLRSHTVMLVAAVLVSAGLTYRWATRDGGLDPRRLRIALLIIAAATLAGGRLHFVLSHLSMFSPDLWRVLRLTSAGLHAPGAILGAITGTVLAVRLLGLSGARFADALALAAGIGIALARIGCFLQGCCFGTVCPYPWGVSYPRRNYVFLQQVNLGLIPPDASGPLPVHPLPLYFAAAALLITGILLLLRRHKRYDGELALIFVTLFSASSAALELFREDPGRRAFWGPWPQLLWITMAMTVTSLAVLMVAEFRYGRRPRGGAAAAQNAAAARPHRDLAKPAD